MLVSLELEIAQECEDNHIELDDKMFEIDEFLDDTINTVEVGPATSGKHIPPCIAISSTIVCLCRQHVIINS